MVPFVVPLLIGAASAAYSYFRDKQNEAYTVYTGVSWGKAILAPVPLESLRGMIRLWFCNNNGCSFYNRLPTSDVFHRGDERITELPTTRQVMWPEVPLRISAAYSLSGERTELRLEFAAAERLQFQESVVSFFNENAEAEYNRTFDWIKAADRERRAAEAARQAPPPTASQDSGRYDDLELLGLKRYASWADVQAAYRDACKKYHPDRLSGRDVPSELVELAVIRFRELTDAYQRLKDRFGR